MPLFQGQQLENLKIINKIGSGGFGSVYLAYDRVKNRKVAVKEMDISSNFNLENKKRFQQEAKIIQSLNNPNIVSFYELKYWNSKFYLILEYVDGGSLRDKLNQNYQFNLNEIIQIGREICNALVDVHKLGIVHRDIKPENILLTSQGQIKITDFGVSYFPQILGGHKFAETGFQPGTIIYMSPWQIKGYPAVKEIDVYAVGVVLYELITGKPYIDYMEISNQAHQLANQNNILFENCFFELITENICTPKKPDLDKLHPNLPKWLSESVSACIEHRMSLNGLLYTLMNSKCYISIFPENELYNGEISKLKHRIMPYLRPKLRDSTTIKSKDAMDYLVHITWPFDNNLIIYLVWDSENSVAAINKSDFEDFGISQSEAWVIGFENLERLSIDLPLEIIQDENGDTVACSFNIGDGYDATRILLPAIRKKLCKTLNQNLCLVGIPDNNLLIAGIPRTDIIKFLKDQIQRENLTRDHPVTPQMYWVDLYGNITRDTERS